MTLDLHDYLLSMLSAQAWGPPSGCKVWMSHHEGVRNVPSCSQGRSPARIEIINGSINMQDGKAMLSWDKANNWYSLQLCVKQVRQSCLGNHEAISRLWIAQPSKHQLLPHHSPLLHTILHYTWSSLDQSQIVFGTSQISRSPNKYFLVISFDNLFSDKVLLVLH
jgi:hypothetical protein